MLQTTVILMLAFLSVGFGLFIYCKPLKAFEIQKRFYELINWRIEPISVQKEIRNTRLMGVFLVLFVIGALLYVFFIQEG